MNPRIEVHTSDFAIGASPQTLVTYGVGSCVAVCLYENQLKVGALLHIMLPRSEGEHLNPLRFADTALSFVLVELHKQAVAPANLTAKLVGGAQMFKAFAASSNIGARNVEEIRRILGAIGIPIESEDVGGNGGRSLEFDLSTGLVAITSRSG